LSDNGLAAESLRNGDSYDTTRSDQLGGDGLR
jgi:hypothetical protein